MVPFRGKYRINNPQSLRFLPLRGTYEVVPFRGKKRIALLTFLLTATLRYWLRQ